MKKILFAVVVTIVVILGFSSCGQYELVVAEPYPFAIGYYQYSYYYVSPGYVVVAPPPRAYYAPRPRTRHYHPPR